MLVEPLVLSHSDHLQGYALLRESHINVMIYPADRFAYVSIVSCKDFDKEEARKNMARKLSARRSI